MRGDCSSNVKNIRTIGAAVQNGIPYLECASDVDTSALLSNVAANCTICNATAAKDGATFDKGNVLADRTIAYR